MAAELGGYFLQPFRLLREPRVVSIIYLAAYILFALGIGGATLLFGHEPGSGVDPWLIDIVGWLSLAGGALAACSLYSGIWWLERLGITLIMAGAGGRMVVVWYLAHPNDYWQRESVLAIVCLLLLDRLLRISGLLLDPTK